MLSKRFVFSLLAVLAACGGGSQEFVPRQTSPFTAEHSLVFDSGADFINTPDLLTGSWRDDWSRVLSSRVSAADFVGVVRVNSVRSSSDPSLHTQFHLMATKEREIIGHAPLELDLGTVEADRGYVSVKNGQREIFQHVFLVFLKWKEDDSHVATPRWHISPATEPILRRVDFLSERRRQREAAAAAAAH